MKKPGNIDDLPEVMNAQDIQRFLGIGRVQVYNLIGTKEFYSVKIGRSIRVSKKNFVDWFQGQQVS